MSAHYYSVIVVSPTPPPKNGGGVQQPFLRTPADGIPPSNRQPNPLADWCPPPFNQQVPHLHGSRPQIRDLGVFMFVQLNKCVVVCGSVLQIGYSGDGCLTSSILFKYERSRGHLFVLSWARVRRVGRTSVVS